ncbi:MULTISPECIES: heme/hemin ABC transporter substrate-binding protein [Vibrio]|uniref:heme/hemin ABC transporter substrate-binding protein n=1 Tax=Vibrio TaxID=662 RepID=UPI003D0A22A4
MFQLLRKTLIISTITSMMAFSVFAQSTQVEATVLPEETQNIISAGASVTELLLALNAQHQLVAVDVTSVLPSSLVLPKVGYHRALSAEGLLAMHPDLIIGTDEMGPKPALDQIKQAGVNVEVVDTSASITGLKKRIDQIAALTHTQDNVAALNDKIDAQLHALTSNQPSTSDEKKKILFLLIHEGRPANVAGSGTTPDAIISLAGGINPAAKQLNAYKPLSNEAIIEMQPDIILLSDRSYRQLGGSDALLKALPMLAATPAGKNQQFVTIDGHALVGGLGLKSLSEAQRLNEKIYQK